MPTSENEFDMFNESRITLNYTPFLYTYMAKNRHYCNCINYMWKVNSPDVGAGVGVTISIQSIVWCYSVSPDLSRVHATLKQTRRSREKTNQNRTGVQRWAREQHCLQIYRCFGSSILTSCSLTPGFHGENPTHILIINSFFLGHCVFIIPYF